MEESLLVIVRNMPPPGAAVPNVTGKFTVLPGATVMLAGTIIPDCEEDPLTLTLALVLPKLGVVAVMVADPSATPLTGTFKLLANAPKTTAEGTVATPVLLEFSVAVSPEAGADSDRFSTRFPAEPALMVKLAGEKKLLPSAGVVAVV